MLSTYQEDIGHSTAWFLTDDLAGTELKAQLENQLSRVLIMPLGPVIAATLVLILIGIGRKSQ